MIEDRRWMVDEQYTAGVIEAVIKRSDGCDLVFDSSWHIFCPDIGIEPHVGESILFFW